MALEKSIALENHGYAICAAPYSLCTQHLTKNFHPWSRLIDGRTGRELDDDTYLRALLNLVHNCQAEPSGAQVIKHSVSLKSFAICVHATNRRGEGVLNPRLTPSFHKVELGAQASRS